MPVNENMMLPAAADERLHIAISMLQQMALAQDTPCDAKRIWGTMYMPGASLDHAIQVLISLVDDLE